MLISLFAAIFIVAFIITLVTIFDEGLVFSILGLVFWVVLFGQSLYLTDVAGTEYNEYGLSGLCLGLALVHLVLFITYMMEFRNKDSPI